MKFTEEQTDANTLIVGRKDDWGKPKMGTVVQGFPLALAAVADVNSYGAEKYTEGGWREVPDGIARYTDAMCRHIAKEGIERVDDESGLMHAAHAAWGALARLELMLGEDECQ